VRPGTYVGKIIRTICDGCLLRDSRSSGVDSPHPCPIGTERSLSQTLVKYGVCRPSWAALSRHRRTYNLRGPNCGRSSGADFGPPRSSRCIITRSGDNAADGDPARDTSGCDRGGASSAWNPGLDWCHQLRAKGFSIVGRVGSASGTVWSTPRILPFTIRLRPPVS
jgi:hypothetical protein